MTDKEKLLYIIKNNGNCSTINCLSCPIKDVCAPLLGKIIYSELCHIFKQEATNKFLTLFPECKDELMEELL